MSEIRQRRAVWNPSGVATPDSVLCSQRLLSDLTISVARFAMSCAGVSAAAAPVTTRVLGDSSRRAAEDLFDGDLSAGKLV